jgi:outer membrane protein
MRITSKNFLALGLLSLALVPVAFAQAQKVAVVDSQRLLAEAPQARAATQTLESEFGPRQKTLEGQKKEFEGRAQKFERDAATMSETERTKLQREPRRSVICVIRK